MAIGSLAFRLTGALLPILWLLAAAATPEPPEVGPAAALFVSDIHFNPFYDLDLVGQLSTADPSDWNVIFATSSQKALGGHGKGEINQNLLASMVLDLRQRRQGASFLLDTGDILAHHLYQR